MDPDLVRQQAEAELEHRARAQVMPKTPSPTKRPAIKAALADITEHAAIRTVIYTPPSKATVPAQPVKPPRWRVYVQALFSSATFAGLAGLAASAWGAKQGLSADGQLWLGSGAAALMAMVYGGLFLLNGKRFTPAAKNP